MEPKFINIEYIFNAVFNIWLWIKYWFLFYLGNTDVSVYLQKNKDDAYDGLRDRFDIASGGPAGWAKKGVSGSSSSESTTLSRGETSYSSSVSNSSYNSYNNSRVSGTASVGNLGANRTNTRTTTSVQNDSLFAKPDNFIGDSLSPLRDLFLFAIVVFSALYLVYRQKWHDVLHKYDADYDKHYAPEKAEVKKDPAPEKILNQNTRLAIIDAHMATQNELEWRLAILEADNLLSELLKTLPYSGETVGERLTNADRKKFTTLEDAWEAHKVRNKIAHEGSEYKLTEREARKVIGLYKNVFAEFNFSA
jgi:hypothetical protein